MNSHKSTRLVTLVVLVTLLVPGTVSLAAGDVGSHSVRVPAMAIDEVGKLGLSPRRALDYGTFYWLELDDGDFATLFASDIPFVHFPDAGRIQVLGFRFDPIVEGQPDLPADVQFRGKEVGLRLVQLVGPPQDGWLAQLEAAGLPLLQYYPHNSYLTWATAAQTVSATTLDFVRWQGAFHPAYKISPALSGFQGRIENVAVTFYNDGAIERTLADLAGLGGDYVQHYPAQPDGVFYTAILALDAGRLSDVARLPTVWAVGYASPEPGFDDENGTQIVAGNYPGGTPVTGYYTWLADKGVDGNGITWADVDTGLDASHPDITGRATAFVSYPGAPAANTDPHGHGTHTCGAVFGDGLGGTGITDTDGFYWGTGGAVEANLVVQNALLGSAWPPAGGWQLLSHDSLVNGAIGSSNSWYTGAAGSQGYSTHARTHDIMVRDGDWDTPSVAEPIIMVFSAGNAGDDCGSPPCYTSMTEPKEAKNLITVGASENYPRSGSSVQDIAYYSSRGPAQDGRILPAVIAPGRQTTSLKSNTPGAYSCVSPVPGAGATYYSYCSGTSMAAPLISGASALIADWWAQEGWGTPSPAMIKALLINGASDMYGGDNGWGTANTHIPNDDQGWGLATMENVIRPDVNAVYRDQLEIFDNTGESWTLSVGIPDPSQPFKVSIVWSDAPGAIGANPALVNDLDLIVDHSGDTYLGNQFSDGWSTPGGSPDALNNLENVYIENPGGNATITVQATTIAGDGVPLVGDDTDQDFALVCYNCALQPDFVLMAEPDTQAVCAPADAVYDITVDSVLGFSDPVSLSTVGEPPGSTIQFSVNPVIPPGTSVMTVTDTDLATPGSYAIDIVGTAPTSTHTTTVGLDLFTAPTVSLASDSPVELGQPVHFVAILSGTPPFTFTWDFGGPGAGSGLDTPTPVFTYTAVGTYTAMVTVENGCGEDADATTVVVDPAPVCTDVASVDLTLVTVGMIYTDTLVEFEADVAPDDASKPYSYTVDYDDGTVVAGDSSDDPLALSYTFAVTGTYTVEVSVWNCEMEVPATDVVTVTVYGQGVCVDLAGITILGETTGEPGTYTFTTSYEPMDATQPISYTWDNGDVEDVSIRDLGVGTHTLLVTATNCAEALVTGTHTIVISGPAPEFYIYLPLVLRNSDS